MEENCFVKLSDSSSAKGKIMHPEESTVPVNCFLGVPYAQPPLGKLRFQPPSPCDLWKGERDCTKFGDMPMQSLEASRNAHALLFENRPAGDNMSEDCLNLNIYTPSLKPADRLPVMVWFHGGGFYIGAGEVYDLSAFASFNNVCVVTVNARLGALGFMTSGDDVIPGNNGLLDQLEALRWLKKNIAAFRGNPENITIFGQSAGSMSCALHVMSDMAEGLFSRAILQSGPACGIYCTSTQQQMMDKFMPKLRDMGYTGDNGHDLLQFLMSKTPEEITKIDETMVVFKPVIDGVYLKEHPRKLYSEGRFLRVPVITGCCSDDGYGALKQFFTEPGLPKTREELVGFYKTLLSYFFKDNQDAIANAAYDAYVTEEIAGDLDLFKRTYSDFTTDTLRMYHIFDAESHAVHAPVYAFTYDYRGSYSTAEDSWVGAIHGEDLHTTLGLAYTGTLKKEITMTETDKQVSQTCMKYWTNFARTGNPNGPDLPNWTPFRPDNQVLMRLNEKPELSTSIPKEHTEFWKKTLPDLII